MRCRHIGRLKFGFLGVGGGTLHARLNGSEKILESIMIQLFPRITFDLKDIFLKIMKIIEK